MNVEYYADKEAFSRRLGDEGSMSLIKNAIESIEIGVEDFQSEDSRRNASAVRNFFAGVLLLLKEVLRQASPPGSAEVLMYSRLKVVRDASGIITLTPGSQNTVDVTEILERFKSLGFQLDAAPLKALQKIRNDVEHHDPSKHTHANVRSAIAKTFVLVTGVMQDYLDMQPAEHFQKDAWEIILREVETFKDIGRRCRQSVEDLDCSDLPDEFTTCVKKFQCPKCCSNLLMSTAGDYSEAEFVCQLCAYKSALEDLLQPALAEVFPEIRSRPGEESDPRIGQCPHCSRFTFVVEHDVCFCCGESRIYENCERCEADMSLAEQETGLCSYCEHMHDRLVDE